MSCTDLHTELIAKLKMLTLRFILDFESIYYATVKTMQFIYWDTEKKIGSGSGIPPSCIWIKQRLRVNTETK